MSYFVTPVVDEWNTTTYELTTAGYTALVVIMLACLLLGCFLFGGKRKISTKQLAFSAMAIALGVVTSLIKIVDMPMGGSVTLLSMLFVCLIGYWYGTGAGITAAIAYGTLQLIIDPYILSVPQLLLDYIFSFGALGLSGFFSHSKKSGLLKGYLLGVTGRYVFAVLSGWIFFGIYAADYGFHSGLTYSLCYNGAYIGLEALITIIIISIPPVKNALSRVKELAME